MTDKELFRNLYTLKNLRLKVVNLLEEDNINSFAEDVKKGLTSKKKFLLPKYFYDNTGSELFEEICKTEEYYPTRTETEILKECSEEIYKYNKENPSRVTLVELGAGSCIKTNYILNAFQKFEEKLFFYPIDVSKIIYKTSADLVYNNLKLFVTGIISEYEEGLKFINEIDKDPKLIIFLGSSIGNFTFNESIDFLKIIRREMNKEDVLLVGFDLVKEKNILEAAYNDSKGVTKKFNLNLLIRINNELGRNFNINNFEHEVLFNEQESRIEMYLVSKINQLVDIKDINLKIDFRKGEKIHTENSYKFTNEMIENLTKSAGLDIKKYWTDEKKYFAEYLLEPY